LLYAFLLLLQTSLPSSCPAGLPPNSKLSSYKALPANDEAALFEALKNGPIAVGVTVDSAFMEYTAGVFSSPTCKGNVSHAVVLIGAGYDPVEGLEYWQIRNRWGLVQWLKHTTCMDLCARLDTSRRSR
jgi:hypothetical protein